MSRWRLSRVPANQDEGTVKRRDGSCGIREIFAGDKETTVTSGSGGLIRIRYGGAPSALLRTKIPLLRLTPLEQYNIRDAEAALESTEEVKAAIKQLRLEEPITVISGLVQEPMEGLPHLPPVIRDVTVDDALDLFAKTFGYLVGYEECIRPDGSRCFSIDHSYIQGGKWFERLRARWDSLRKEGFKTGICPVHRVRLQNSPVYGWSRSADVVPLDPRMQDPPDSLFQREEQYPMRLGYGEKLTPSKDFQNKKTERFCAKCQTFFEADLKRYPVARSRRERPSDYNFAPLGDQY